MPELPEVETIVRGLRPFLRGQRIESVEILWPPSIDRPAPQDFAAAVEGRIISDVKRRGKYILMPLDDGSFLIFHLRLTGQLLINSPENLRHTRLVMRLGNGGKLSFLDARKLGRVYWVRNAAEVVGHLGPEPLKEEFTLRGFAERLKKHRCRIKSLLLDQRFLAGLGNIYTDEALFLAGINPLRPADSLSPDEVQRLYRAIRTVLRQGIAHRGTTFSSYLDAMGNPGENQEALQVFRRQGKPCPRCGTLIEKIRVGGRSTHFCPRCQPLGQK